MNKRPINIIPIFFGLTYIWNIIFAIGVYRSARKLRLEGKEIMFAPPIVWALNTTQWGVFMMLPYWLFNFSKLRE